jgi:hypothetical protein
VWAVRMFVDVLVVIANNNNYNYNKIINKNITENYVKNTCQTNF